MVTLKIQAVTVKEPDTGWVTDFKMETLSRLNCMQLPGNIARKLAE